MKRPLLTLCSLLWSQLFWAASSPAAPSSWLSHAQAPQQATYANDRILIKFTTRLDQQLKADTGLQSLLGAGLQTAKPLAQGASTPLVAGVDRIVSVQVESTTDIPLLARKLSRLHNVEYAEPVLVYDLQPIEAGAANKSASRVSPSAVPNDPAWAGSAQENMQLLQLEAAWDVVKGETSSPVVCVIDGGTNWQHEDLAANMWVNPGEIPGNSIDDDGNGYVDDVHGWNFHDDSGNVRGDWANTPGGANHGTHTGGLLAAVTNNAIGLASASWNPRLMAVNAAGSNDNSIAFGYSGLLYAAENGADIVSLSWGGNSGSNALQDIVDFAVSQGVLILAAAGNNNNDIPFFPAAYRGVFAVANVWGSTDVRYGGASGSCYGGWLDVAAPGAAMYATFDMNATNAYGFSTGTSMSCPVAASVAALIQSQNPTWGPLKVGEKLRVTCDNINSVNPGFEDLLGKGRVNAFRAVSETGPAVRVVDWSLEDADGNGELNRGELVTVHLDLHNYHSAALGPSVSLTSSSAFVTVLDGMENFADLPEDGDTTLTAAFQFQVAANAAPGERIALRIGFAATSYSDFQFLPAVLEPEYKTHDIHSLQVSLTSTGNVGWIGFAGGLAGEKGRGFSLNLGPDLLFEGALLLGTSATSLSDAARNSDQHSDFSTDGTSPPLLFTPGSKADQEITAVFYDSGNTGTPLGVAVSLHSYAYAAPEDDGFVLLRYEIRNVSGATLSGLRAGLFCDWDIDAANFGSNRAAFDAARNLGYAWDQSDPSLPTTGIQALNGDTVHYSAIRNDGQGQPINIYDGFSKSEKWLLLATGTGITSIGPTDISNAISTGPWTLAPGDSALAWFAVLAAADLPTLQVRADRAAELYADLVVTSIAEENIPPGSEAIAPRRLALLPAVPNPFNPGTTLRLSVDQQQVLRVHIHDVRGRRVRTLVEGLVPAGESDLTWDGRDDTGNPVPSGVYFATLGARSGRQIQRLVLMR